MKAILVNDDRSLRWDNVPDPVIKADEVLVEIHAAALNRADLMQREGDYPPPPGCPEWMGLEIAGVITQMGDEAKAKSNWIAHELDAWMSEISPGTKILANELPGLDIVKMSVQFETKHKISEDKFVNEYTDEYSPVNVGFGIPYVLPLILSLLISNPGDLVLIENPESHLHPKGQSMIGKLIAVAAQSGVQIICETHSDHIINGIRVATKNSIIANDKVRLFYFDKNEETKLETEVTTINVDKNGELDNYPEGLLDEWGNLMSQLF